MLFEQSSTHLLIFRIIYLTIFQELVNFLQFSSKGLAFIAK